MDYFPALNVFLFVVSLSSSILDWSFFKCLRNGREVDLVQADCSQDWVGTGRLPPPTPTPAWPGGLAHLGVIGLVGRANRQNLGLHTTESLMIVCIRVQFSAQSPGRERVEELWKGNRLD